MGDVDAGPQTIAATRPGDIGLGDYIHLPRDVRW